MLGPHGQHRLPEQPHEPTGIGREPRVVGAGVEPQPLNAQGGIDGVARKGGIAARVEHDVGAHRLEAVVKVTEPDVGDPAGAGHLQPGRDGSLRAHGGADATVPDVESRVLAPGDAACADDPRQRPALEAAFDLDGRATLAAPRQRRRQSRPPAEHVHEAHTHAVGEAVAVLAAQDRHPHGVRPERAHGAGVGHVDGDAGPFLDDDDDEDRAGIAERRVPLAHVDAAESAAVVEGLADAGERVDGKRLPGLDRGQTQHLGVGRRVVAVDADLDDALLWRRGLSPAFRG